MAQAGAPQPISQMVSVLPVPGAATTLPSPTAEPAQQKKLSAAVCVCRNQEEMVISTEE